ncbi:hypothetical protein AOQ84DRAFT_374299 [Glonium stellatum]|uniref:N(6)-L-threonylcarbamoyladenine synthase n=1 Tax=Glonium stellatum TaxID=574774 RepID=A0A8E2JVH1_9PEZI|nr:hypothetical protein AOQ84DRAFT_374299 [Glonium stellatum]
MVSFSRTLARTRGHASALPRISRRLLHDKRPLVTLAIETSCDDTSVAVLEYRDRSQSPRAILHFHKKITSDNSVYQGVHPVVSLESHQESLAALVNEAVQNLPEADCCEEDSTIAVANKEWPGRKPDFVSVTRGPGMRSNLFTGLDTAKGLAVAWQVPLVGVHHMQAHALTPRLVAALQPSIQANLGSGLSWDIFKSSKLPEPSTKNPEFPFLSVLVSGGHTLLIHSTSLTDHKVLASASDIAIGDCLDKIARVVLPAHLLKTSEGTMYGALLEKFAFPEVDMEERMLEDAVEEDVHDEVCKKCEKDESPYCLEDRFAIDYNKREESRQEYGYTPPKSRDEEHAKRVTEWGWGFSPPLSHASGGAKSKSMEFSFTGLVTAVERVVRFSMDKTTGKLSKVERAASEVTEEERMAIAREAMRAAFEHLTSRVIMGLGRIQTEDARAAESTTCIIVSGGVAANGYLRHILGRMLTERGYPNMRLIFPPRSLCTDNAAMIAWAGIEMFRAGHTDPLSIRALRKWPLDQLLHPLTGN